MSHDTPRTEYDVEQAAARLERSHPADILAEALAQFPGLSISFSGAEDVALIDMAQRAAGADAFRVFSLDTGRLHGETLAFIERVREPLRDHDRARQPAGRAARGAGAREGTVLLPPRRASGMLRDPQGRAARPRAARRPRLRNRPAQGPEPRHPLRPAGGAARCWIWTRGGSHGQVQSPGQLLIDAGLGLHPDLSRALQPVARPRLQVDRLRALHPRRRTPASTNGPASVVVGRGDAEGVRGCTRST